MATFIAISGPSSSGKTSIVNNISMYREMRSFTYIPDIFQTVWDDLVARGLLSEYDDINKDQDFLCVFILHMIDYYNMCLDEYEHEDGVVVLDCCWLDLAIYAVTNLWYMHAIKAVQEDILSKLNRFDERISRIYVTKFDKSYQKSDSYQLPFKRSNVKSNRKLEIEYYELAKNLKNAVALPSSDISEASLAILEDLRNLGYL